MKRTVNISFTVDSNDYEDVEDSDNGVIDLVIAMFADEADFPEEITIKCGEVELISGE